ncbi:TPA: hypothetical protein I7787_21510 [Vibrio vulnificus]|nr:hypothetical protein [Vibrio parahaemolyticus]EJX1092845.1 hypothetical protein [Vibrio vulnificus]ELH3492489.1 hypothetical protein [Vibrio vulnificus]HAS6834692.1 hypothetical protein [Vibrio parahaemolyticus]HAS6943289.1 hypothetical protein [Vibrio parahaemolyticus]
MNIPIIMDKTTPQEEWYRNDIELSVKSIISRLCLALQKTPIYAFNDRKLGSELIADAEARLKRRLSNVTNLFVNSELLLNKINEEIENKDRADLVVRFTANAQDWVVIIEYDAARADQVSKKFVSRVGQLPKQNLFYIACCYSGTKKMSLPETKKYFSCISNISQGLGIAGFVGMCPPKNRG